MSGTCAHHTITTVAAAFILSIGLAGCATQAVHPGHDKAATLPDTHISEAAEILRPSADDSPLVAALKHRVATGNVPAEVRLGLAYLRGRGLQQDYTKARILFEDAAAHRGPAAMADLGLMYLRGIGVRQNSRKALAWFQRSAQEIWPAGQYWLGYMYENGIGTAKNLHTARSYMAQAAAGGFRPAANALATLQKEIKHDGHS